MNLFYIRSKKQTHQGGVLQEELRSRLVTLLRCYIVTFSFSDFGLATSSRTDDPQKDINVQAQYCSSFILPFYNIRLRAFFQHVPVITIPWKIRQNKIEGLIQIKIGGG